MTGRGLALLLGLAFLLTGAGAARPVYAYRGGRLVVVPLPAAARAAPPVPCPRLDLPRAWDVRDRAWQDVTGDGRPECVLALWRPWRDQPVRRWAVSPSLVAGNHDRRGWSAHVAAVRPTGGGRYRELWVGSAMALPVVRLRVGDVDGDGRAELVLLEGDYKAGRDGPARRLAVWRWSGFGFDLAWRGGRGSMRELELLRLAPGGPLAAAVR